MPRYNKRKTSAVPVSTLRLIGGRHRGRKLPIPALDGLRPTSDRTRETLFNWLQFELPGMHVLDLFAGTGALGLEALSRDAESAVFVEPQSVAAEGIRQSLQTLNLTAEVRVMVAEQFLEQTDAVFDLVFVDPPFSLDLWQSTVDRLAVSDRLSSGGYIYVEAPVGQTLTVPDGLTVVKEKTAGKVRFQLWQKAGVAG
ncbi:16S rRNA (guanine(966)-N(2))-methyltransferase RsmD [Reinekea blandensis]|uniref:16S rRNA (guanine(966)-N(2))-methyltransferase RsmD n=1 Tax=Reinekea blandensis TaxID=374838 RepID=UPI0009FFC856|nr:16S rRNA (guanine(966)-N(2))-methyltransferase RsmD [Reinekea blandensis]